MAVELDASGREVVEPRQAAPERRLPTAGLAHQTERLPAAHLEAHAVDRLDDGAAVRHEAAPPDREVLDHALGPQEDVPSVPGCVHPVRPCVSGSQQADA